MNRLHKILTIRKKFREGNYSIGSWMQIPHASIAEILGNCGYDWVAVDLEHGSISINQLPDIFRALELGETLPLVRIAQSSIKDCKQALDAGAGGVIIPMVENAEQLKMVRDACRWPPTGSRGVAFSRANLFGNNFDEYSEEAQKPLLVAMIENEKAIDNLSEILKVEGLDAIMVGPYDLSASMGITAQFENVQFKNALNIIKSASDKAKIPCGIHVVEPSISKLEEMISGGYRFLAYSIDSVFLNTSAVLPVIGRKK